MSEMASFKALINGRVQGVFFRATVETWAQQLGVNGFVRNLPGGSVEVYAEGSRPQLETLAERCKKGPPSARVDDFSLQWAGYKGEFKGFSIR